MGPEVCGACLILTDVVNYPQATTSEREMVKTSVGSLIKVSSVSSLSQMSTVQGIVGEKPVEVLRDTGCSGVIVSKDLVLDSAYTGRSQTMVMVDYSLRVVPEVKVNVWKNHYTPNGYIVPMEFRVHFFPSISALLRRTKMHLNGMFLIGTEFFKIIAPL